MIFRSKHIVLFLLLFCIQHFWAQSVEVKSKFDKKAVYIGEQFKLSIKVIAQNKLSFEFPKFEGDTIINEIEVIKRPKSDTTINDSLFIYKQDYILTSFDSGYHAIPPIKIFSEKDTFESKALLIHIKDFPVDTTQGIKPIKDIVEAPPAPTSLFWLWITLVAALIIALIIYYLKKRKAAPIEQAVPKPSIPPHIEALSALKLLAEQKLWQQGKIKEYHSRLTDIVRLYLEKRFGIPALEQTTEEILSSINRTQVINITLAEKLGQILRLADAAKFAKAKPIASENEASFLYADEIINSTKQTDLDNN